jgi:menaquinone-dependent protoporphyrinogen oxidase
MSRILIAYGTGEGQTGRVAARIADAARERGHGVESVDLGATTPGDPSEYDAVVLGASIHAGSHQESVREFARAHREELAALPTAFFQVCLTAAEDTEEARETTDGYVAGFVDETGFEPDAVATFAGAIAYSKYGFLKRLLMKRIAASELEATDTSRDYEFTDWDAVDDFAGWFLDGLRPPGEGTTVPDVEPAE